MAQKSLYELEREDRMVSLKIVKKGLKEIIGKKPMLTVDVKLVSN